MISVTVAAQGKSKRMCGSNLKAYGAGRLSIFDLDKSQIQAPKDCQIGVWCKFFSKLFELLFTVLSTCFPYLCAFLNEIPKSKDPEEAKDLLKIKSTLPIEPFTPINVLGDDLLARILECVDANSVLNCELVCKKWRKVIDDNIEVLPKIHQDQIRLLFDEGEIIIYQVDEKRVPARHHMPSLQLLARHLRHMRCLSLFVRGLIPVESIPVFRSLCDLHLFPQQIYFIWCKFAPSSIPMLAELLRRNKETTVDLGLEECIPSCLITDSLFEPLLPTITSLRVWNDGKSGGYGLTDRTIMTLAEGVRGGSGLETLDVASCPLSIDGIVALVTAWTVSPSTDLTLSFNYCTHVSRSSLLPSLAAKGIFLNKGKLHRCGHCLTLFV